MKKFDFVIGNPPYQKETNSNPKGNNQKRVKNVFPFFQKQADKISNEGSVLIYPGARWIHRAGKGMKDFGLKQINDRHLSTLIFYPNAKEVFSDIDVSDGLTIVSKNYNKNSCGFKYIYKSQSETLLKDTNNPGEKLMPLYPKDISINDKIEKFVKNNDLVYLNDRILSQKFFGIESNFIENNKDKSRLMKNENDYFDKNTEIKLFANDKAGKAGRTKWFIVNKDLIEKNKEYIKQWQVVVSSANAGGQKRDNKISIVDNYSAFARSRVGLGTFKTEKEARNFYNYCESYVIKYCFLMTDESLSSLGKRVPDIINYKEDSIIDFSKNIDKQLCELIDITDYEFNYIESRVKNIRRKNGKS